MMRALMTAAIIGMASCAQGGEQALPHCKTAILTVDNLSNRQVQIIAVRWLNVAAAKWNTLAVEAENVPVDGKWQTQVCLNGLETSADHTFMSIRYRMLLDQNGSDWSPVMDGKQARAPLDAETISVRLDVARRNI